MFRINVNDIKKQLKRLGIKNVDVETFEAEEVTILRQDGKTLRIETPQVAILKMPNGTAMLQIIATSGIEEVSQQEITTMSISISEEDIQLVAEQAGVSLEEARKALVEHKGDIAAAILALERKKASSSQ